ncbi:hydrogenase [bacterium SCSIO 12741]|nr:hydrogenase [bacterium SCSIO 12741]
MLVKFSHRPLFQMAGIVRFNYKAILFFVVWSTLLYFIHTLTHWSPIMSVVPVTILGGALAIFLGFRNNSAYDRWWEARKIWGGVVNISRSFGMEVNSLIQSEDNPEGVEKIRRRLIYRHLAWINALRIQLRKQDSWDELKDLLPAEEFERLSAHRNKATQLLHRQGTEIAVAHQKGWINDYQQIELNRCLTEMYDLQGKAERIKGTVFPYYYQYFTRFFMRLFIVLLPMSLMEEMDWQVIPMSTLISFVFYILEKSGHVTEDPFENRASDTPMSAICTTIEIDLRQQLGESEIPDTMVPEKTRFGVQFLP